VEQTHIKMGLSVNAYIAYATDMKTLTAASLPPRLVDLFAHELKTPLANIALPAELAYMDLEKLELGSQAVMDILPNLKRRLKYIMDQAMQASSRVDALQELSDLGPLLHQSLQIGDVVRVALESLQAQIQQSGTAMTYKIPEDLPSVLGDARQLEMALMNLIKNALDAMSQSMVRHLSLTATVSPNHITLSVQDTGAGISEDIRSRVFDAHFSTKPGRRRGMGLYLVRQILHAHGGDVYAESGGRQGSRFVLVIPREK
jgi:signal transduction histidine kinase